MHHTIITLKKYSQTIPSYVHEKKIHLSRLTWTKSRYGLRSKTNILTPRNIIPFTHKGKKNPKHKCKMKLGHCMNVMNLGVTNDKTATVSYFHRAVCHCCQVDQTVFILTQEKRRIWVALECSSHLGKSVSIDVNGAGRACADKSLHSGGSTLP